MSKVIPFKIPKSQKEFVRFQIDKGEHFYDKLHQHPEWQLTFILEGKGQLMVGDYIGRFEPGDVFLLGANIPHVFRSDEEYFKGDTSIENISKIINVPVKGLKEKDNSVDCINIHPERVFSPHRWNQKFHPSEIKEDTLAVHHFVKSW
jgi:hypothetical protein